MANAVHNPSPSNTGDGEGEGMNTDMWTIEKGEGCDIDNGLDREPVDAIVDDVDKNAH